MNPVFLITAVAIFLIGIMLQSIATTEQTKGITETPKSTNHSLKLTTLEYTGDFLIALGAVLIVVTAIT